MAKTKTVIKNCNKCRYYDDTLNSELNVCNYYGKPALLVRNVYCLGALHWEPIPKQKKKNETINKQ